MNSGIVEADSLHPGEQQLSTTRSEAVVVPYASGRTMAAWVMALLCCGIVLNVAAMVVIARQVQTLQLAEDPEVIRSTAEIMANARLSSLVKAQFAVTIATAVAFLVWWYRAYRNLPALGALALPSSPEWAVGWFLIPLFNWFRPYQIAKQIWKASDPNLELTPSEQWKDAPRSPLLLCWWGLWIISGFGEKAYGRMLALAEETPDVVAAGWAGIGSKAITIAAGILAISVVFAITRRQDVRASKIASA